MKILIIEDDPASIDIVSLIFKVSRPDVQLISAKLGGEGLDLIEKEGPDVVILDLGLPDIDGFEVLKRLRLFSDVPVIVLTVRGEENDVVKALEFGANEYIVKPLRQFEFLARVNNVMNKGGFLHGKPCLNFGPFNFDVSTKKLMYMGKVVYLTGTESQILYHLAINRDKVVTYHNLYENIWGEYYPGEENALRVHIQRLRKKIESGTGKRNLIITKPGIGYTLNTSNSS